MDNILSRIEKIAINEGIKITRLEQIIGASKGVLSRAINNKTDIQSKWIQAIVENYPKYSEEWLLTGKGEMLKKEESRSFSHIVGDGNLVGSNLSGLSGTFLPTIQKGETGKLKQKFQDSRFIIENEALKKETLRLESEIQHLKLLLAEKDKVIKGNERLIQVLMNTKKD